MKYLEIANLEEDEKQDQDDQRLDNPDQRIISFLSHQVSQSVSQSGQFQQPITTRLAYFLLFG